MAQPAGQASANAQDDRPGTGRLVRPGRASVHKSSGLGFPVYRLLERERSVASFGRYSFFKIYIGTGQRIELPDGSRWRLRAVGIAGDICPVIVNSEGQRVAQAGLKPSHYGINGPDYAYGLIPIENLRIGRPIRWTLTHRGDYVAQFTRRPREVMISEAVHLSAVLLSFVLMDFGIPGEQSRRIPSFKWA